MEDQAMAGAMTLYLNRTSPFARKVLVLIHEKGMEGDVAVVEVDPWSDPPDLLAVNPLSRIPALLLPDGAGLVESWAIADYLDHVGPGPRLMPQTGLPRMDTLKLMGLAQGLMDAAFAAVLESRRPEPQRAVDRLARHRAAIQRTLTRLDQRFTWNIPDPVDPLDMGAISVGAALSYLDFRHADLVWRDLAENVEPWFDAIRQRPSFRATEFG